MASMWWSWARWAGGLRGKQSVIHWPNNFGQSLWFQNTKMSLTMSTNTTSLRKEDIVVKDSLSKFTNHCCRIPVQSMTILEQTLGQLLDPERERETEREREERRERERDTHTHIYIRILHSIYVQIYIYI